MDHAEIFSTMVPPSSPGLGLGLTPNPVLSQENYPNLSRTTQKRLRSDSDDEIDTSFMYKPSDNFAKFLVIKSDNVEQPITSLSPFIIEKQIEALIGTPKTVKKLKNKTLLVETTRKTQTEHLLKVKQFFNLQVTVSEHTTLNTSKGIIRDRALKGESEQSIVDYLKNQGVVAAKRFKINKDHETVETNTILLTFNMVTVPKSLRIFYRIIPVEIYVPNPLRCFNCQRFAHHENNCPVDIGSVCDKCGEGNYSHIPSKCPNPIQSVNCGQNHLSRSSDCEIWKKEKEIMRIKVTKNITYFEAKKEFEQTPEVTFSRIVQSAVATKPETKTTGTQIEENDTVITASTKLIEPRTKKHNKSTSQTSTSSTKPQPKATASTSKPAPSNSQAKSNKPQSTEKGSRESRSVSKSGAQNRSKSKSPRAKPVRLTRVQSESVKVTNMYNGLEEMEEDLPPNT